MMTLSRLFTTTIIAATIAAPTHAAAPASKKGTANFEVTFMTEMIEHHAMAIEMAELCLDRAVHGELQQMCSDIIASQSAEIDQMQSWLATWYHVSAAPEMSPKDERMMEMLASLTGDEFEIAFMQEMIRHHEIAIRRARRCEERAAHPELIDMCEEIVATQSEEIQTMQTWLCAWYQCCDQSCPS